MPKISSFSRLPNNVSEKVHYLQNYYSYSDSESGIRKRITFPIAIYRVFTIKWNKVAMSRAD